MARAGQLLVDIDARTARMEAELGKVETRLRGLGRVGAQAGRSLKGIERSFTSATSAAALFGKALAFAGITVGVGALKSLVDNSLRSADALAKAADRIGVATDELQELRFGADQSGIAVKTLEMGLQRFSRRIGEAHDGTGQLGKKLKEIGIDIYDQENRLKSTRDLLGEYADKIAGAGSAQEQLRLAVIGFDSEAATMVNLLRGGSDGLDEFAARARELGVVLDSTAIRSTEVLVSRIDALRQAAGAKLQNQIIQSAESVHTLLDAFEGGIPSDVLTTWVAPFQASIADALTSIADFSEAGGEAIGGRFGRVFAFLRRALLIELPANLKAAIQIAVVEVESFDRNTQAQMDELRAGLALVFENIRISIANAFSLGGVQNFVKGTLDRMAGLADKLASTFDGTRILGGLTEGLSERAASLRAFGDSLSFGSEQLAKVERERDEAAAVYRDRIAEIGERVEATTAALEGSRDAIFAERDATIASTEASVEKAKAELDTAAAVRARMLAEQAAARAKLALGGGGTPDAPQEPTGRATRSRTTRVQKSEAEKAAEEAARAGRRLREEMASEAKSLIESLRTPEEAHAKRVERIGELYDANLLSATQAAEAEARSIERVNAELDRNLTEMQELGRGAAQALEASFADFLFDPFEKGLGGMVDSFTTALRRMAANAAAEGLAKAIFGGGGASGGGGGDALGGIFSSVIGAVFRAGGGQAFAGRPTIVGEQGPELIVPQRNSRVVPNHALGDYGNSTTVNQTFNFAMQSGQPVDRRSATQVRAAALAGTQAALRKVQ